MKTCKTIMVVVGLILSSCASIGKTSRHEALFPAVAMAWGTVDAGVQADVVRGINDAVEDGDFLDGTVLLSYVDSMSAAIEAEDTLALGLVPWDTLKQFAERGIDDRVEDNEMVEAAADFLRRRLVNFDEAVRVLTDPYYAQLTYPSIRTDLRSRVATPQGKMPVVAVVQAN